MTKAKRAEMWFKNGFERQKNKQLEEHIKTIVKWIFLGALIVIWLISYLQNWR